jgi:hypothetical protein
VCSRGRCSVRKGRKSVFRGNIRMKHSIAFAFVFIMAGFLATSSAYGQPPYLTNYWNCVTGTGPMSPTDNCGSLIIVNPGTNNGHDPIPPDLPEPCNEATNCGGKCCQGRCVFASCPPPPCIPNKTCEPPPDVCKMDPKPKTCPVGTTEVGPDHKCFVKGGCEGGSGNCYPKTCPFAAAVIKCSNIYVFSPDEQMIACCGCPTSANGLRTLSVARDLLSNTLTPSVPRSGMVKIVASTLDPFTGTCNPGVPIPAPFGVAAWATHVRTLPTGPSMRPALSETPFLGATLSSGEQSRLTNLCQFIQANDSGYGICSCGTAW